MKVNKMEKVKSCQDDVSIVGIAVVVLIALAIGFSKNFGFGF